MKGISFDQQLLFHLTDFIFMLCANSSGGGGCINNFFLIFIMYSQTSYAWCVCADLIAVHDLCRSHISMSCCWRCHPVRIQRLGLLLPPRDYYYYYYY